MCNRNTEPTFVEEGHPKAKHLQLQQIDAGRLTLTDLKQSWQSPAFVEEGKSNKGFWGTIDLK